MIYLCESVVEKAARKPEAEAFHCLLRPPVVSPPTGRGNSKRCQGCRHQLQCCSMGGNEPDPSVKPTANTMEKLNVKQLDEQTWFIG